MTEFFSTRESKVLRLKKAEPASTSSKVKMLSINTVTSGIREKEEYYTEDESLASSQESVTSYEKKKQITSAISYGKGATELGLELNLTQDDFKSLFYGFKPGTQERIRGEKTNPNNQERLAEDLTFSAPKSVSMALHLNQDLRLFEAHTSALQEVLDVIEARYIQTRIQTNGERKVVNTGNLTAALIPHHTSRDGDMQLHTHAVIFNGTKAEDGKWRALHNDELANQNWLGQLYRQKLATKVQQLGYSIYETANGFELKGISQKDIQVFSKRTQKIINKLQKEGKDITPENRDEATLTTRSSKNNSRTLTEYQQQWKAEAVANNIKVPVPQKNPVINRRQTTAIDSVDSAIAHLSERSVSFKNNDIYKYVLDSGIHNFDLPELERAIKTNKKLIPLGKDKFTTVEAVNREIATVQRWMKGQDKAEPLLSNPNLEETILNSGQSEAITQWQASPDRPHLKINRHSSNHSRTLRSRQNYSIRSFKRTVKRNWH